MKYRSCSLENVDIKISPKTKEKDDCDRPESTIAKELVNEQIQLENDEGKGTPRKRQTCGKRGTYVSYTPAQRRDIGKYAAEHGNSTLSSVYTPLKSRISGINILCILRFAKNCTRENKDTTFDHKIAKFDTREKFNLYGIEF